MSLPGHQRPAGSAIDMQNLAGHESGCLKIKYGIDGHW